jgi:hypothetical protein
MDLEAKTDPLTSIVNELAKGFSSSAKQVFVAYWGDRQSDLQLESFSSFIDYCQTRNLSDEDLRIAGLIQDVLNLVKENTMLQYCQF